MIEIVFKYYFECKKRMQFLCDSLLLCLQEDYVKWKGPLFFRIVMCTVDEDASLNKFGK